MGRRRYRASFGNAVGQKLRPTQKLNAQFGFYIRIASVAFERTAKMSTIDFSPLYRTMVGFDRMANLIDTAQRLDGGQGYPPCNIEQVDENSYAIEIAVAGLAEDDLDIEMKEG